MATNWNEILSNTNNLNDVLSILKKVLAGLETKADFTTINEALQDIEGLKVDIGFEVENVNTTLDQFQAKADDVIAKGFYTGYATETALKASLPAVSEMRARADDTRKIWRWNRTSAEGVTPVTGTWTDTGLSDLDQAKGYADEKTKAIDLDQNKNVIHAVLSADGTVLEYTDSNGNKYLIGNDAPLQEQLTTAPSYPYKVVTDDNATSIVDSDNYVFLHIKKNGETFAGCDIKSLQFQNKENLAKQHINTITNTQNEASRITLAKSVLSANNDPFFKIKDVASYTGVSGEIQRIAAIMKVAEGRILCFWGGGVAGYDGDAEGVKLYKTFINYDKFNNITVEPKVLFREPASIEQVSKHPMLGRLQDGRIILVWDDGVWTGYKQYVSYSSDNGLTWTTPVLLFDNAWVCGSTGKIITLPSGRLVLPMYINNTTFLVYSDDNGATWLQSNILSSTTYNLVEPAAELNAAGEIIVAIRTQANKRYRYYAKSIDNGQTLIDLGQNTTLPSNDCASSLAFDIENGLMFHAVPSAVFSRTAYEIRVSSDGGYDFPIKYHPFDDQEYIGYSQIIALGGNKYAVVAEGFNMLSATINRKENLKIAIFNLNEVIHNVRTN